MGPLFGRGEVTVSVEEDLTGVTIEKMLIGEELGMPGCRDWKLKNHSVYWVTLRQD